MSDRKEIDKWRGAIGIEAQAKGPLFNEIQQIDSLLEDNRKLLDRSELEGRSFVVVTEFNFNYEDPDSHQYRTGTAFFMRPARLKSKTGAFSEREEPFVYAYVKPSVSDGSKEYALQLDVLRGTITDRGTNLSELEDEELIKRLITASTSTADVIVRRLQAKRKEKVAKRNGKLAVAATMAAALGGVAFGVNFVIDKIAEKNARAEAAENDFDASDYQLPGGVFSVSEGKIAKISDRDFDRIPSYDSGDDLQDARRLTVDEEECRVLDVKVPNGSQVHVATNETHDFQSIPVGLAENLDGNLVVCNPVVFGDSQDNDRQIAIQVVPPSSLASE